MEAVTPREFFEKVLLGRFNSSKAAGVDAIVQVSITGPNGGNWVVTIKDQKLKVDEGTNPSPTLSLKMADKDYMDLINGKVNGATAFFTGKVQLKGNIALALKLKETGFL
jgi:putative sterol carrier protein